MPVQPNTPLTPEQRRRRRARRRRLFRLRQRAIELAVLAAIVLAVAVPVSRLHHRRTAEPAESTPPVSQADAQPAEPRVMVYPEPTAQTVALGEELNAASAVLVDVTDHTVVAARDADAVLYPASVAKVMTLLVAAEHITDLDDTFTMTYAILHPLFSAQATIAGFSEGEAVRLQDLLYGLILPSGADAAGALAVYVAGSEEQFAVLMNEKAAELGLKNTHFTNTSGLHDPQLYTTARDIAVMMEAAMGDPLCRQVLSTYQYTTAATPQHPEGILLTSTMFSRMYGDEPEGARVIAGKTGFTDQAGNTMVSYAEGDDGHSYIFVSLKGNNRWGPIFDAIKTYSRFCGGVLP